MSRNVRDETGGMPMIQISTNQLAELIHEIVDEDPSDMYGDVALNHLVFKLIELVGNNPHFNQREFVEKCGLNGIR